MSRKITWICDRCKKEKDMSGIINMGNFGEDKMFFTEPVPNRYRLDCYLCRECLNEYKRMLDIFFKMREGGKRIK